MNKLSLAASATAWQLSAHEAAAGRHSLIKAKNLLIGICSLEKICLSNAENDLEPLSQKELQVETAAVEEILGNTLLLYYFNSPRLGQRTISYFFHNCNAWHSSRPIDKFYQYRAFAG
jgi:hypothetical protein